MREVWWNQEEEDDTHGVAEDKEAASLPNDVASFMYPLYPIQKNNVVI